MKRVRDTFERVDDNKDVWSKDKLVDELLILKKELDIGVLGPKNRKEAIIARVIEEFDKMKSKGAPRTESKQAMIENAKQLLDEIEAEHQNADPKTKKLIEELREKVE